MTVIGSAFVEISPKLVSSFASDTTKALTAGLQSATSKLSELAKGVGKNISDSVQSGLDPSGIAPRLDASLRDASEGSKRAGQTAGADFSAGFATDAADKLREDRKKLAPSDSAGAKTAGEEAGSEYGTEFGEKAQDSIKEHLRGLAELAVGYFAGAEAFSVIKESVEASEQLGSALRVTQAVITATGGAAGVTAKQVQALATSLSFKIGINTTDVEKAANVLLTFKGIAGSTFADTLKAAGDLQGVFKTDLAGAALQLGKALNDPANGLTKLARVGVSFTDQEKQLVTSLEKSGNLLGAQKIILGEVATQFGGAGEAAATAGQRFSVAFTNLKTALGGGIADALEKLTPAISGVLGALGPALKSIGGILGTVLAPLGAALGGAVVALAPGLKALATVFAQIVTDASPLLVIVAKIASAFLKELGPSIANILKGAKPAIDSFVKLVESAFGKDGTLSAGIGPILESVLKPLAANIGPLATAFSGLFTQLIPLIPAFAQLIPPFTQLLTLIAGRIVFPQLTAFIDILAKLAQVTVPLFVGSITVVAKAMQYLSDIIQLPFRALGNLLAILGRLTHLPGFDSVSKSIGNVTGSLSSASTQAGATASNLGKVNSAAGNTKPINDAAAATSGLSDQYGVLNDALQQAATLLQAFLDLASGEQKTAGATDLSVIGDARQQLQLYLQTASGEISKPEGLLEQQQNIFKAQADILPQLSQLAIQSGGNFDTFRQKVLLLAGSLTTNVSQSLGISTEKAQEFVAQVLKVPTQAEFKELVDDSKVKPAVDQINTQLNEIAALKTVSVQLALNDPGKFISDLNAIIQAGVQVSPNKPFKVTLGQVQYAYGGITTEDRIDHNGSNRREVVIPLDRGRQRILELLHQSGLDGVTSKTSALAVGPGASDATGAMLRQLLDAIGKIQGGDTFQIASMDPLLSAFEVIEQKKAAAFRLAKAS